MNIIRYQRRAARATLAASFVFLASCAWLPSWLGGTPSRTVQPTPLTEIKPTLSTRIAWRASIGAG
ncbi:MAG: hypothetical protein ACRECQ_15950, partial [Burkholderiaceae bacterium]